MKGQKIFEYTINLNYFCVWHYMWGEFDLKLNLLETELEKKCNGVEYARGTEFLILLPLYLHGEDST